MDNNKRQLELNAMHASPFFDIQLLKPKVAAEIIGFSERTLRRNAESWRIPHQWCGNRRRYPLASLIRWMKEREVS